jgi:hypothetical protein
MKLSVSKIFDAGQVIQAFVNAKIEGAEDFVRPDIKGDARKD